MPSCRAASQLCFRVCVSLAAACGLLRRFTTLPHSLPLQISENDVRFVRTLGSGASGVVQKAFLPRESRFVAVKKISVLERDKRHQVRTL